ncbi:MAG: glucosaminidase domain-containing protein [Sneathiella sp.]
MKNDVSHALKMAVSVFVLGTSLVTAFGYMQHGGEFFQKSKPAGFQVVSLNSFEDFGRFFSSNGFSISAWRSGEQLVPRIILTDIPEAWGDEIAPNLEVKEKKTSFFSIAVPLVLTSNEEIQENRELLLSISPDEISHKSEAWLLEQAERYRIKDFKNIKNLITKLNRRMDIVPVSIAVAQMAEESGWGTSRFAAEGNALFGQWSYKGGMKPRGQRSEKGDYRIQRFDSPLDSVRAYMLNLNSNKAYTEFRQEREILRNSTGTVSGKKLVEFLTSYSERGEKYIEGLKSIISVNELSSFDSAQLDPKPGFYLEL